MSYFFEGGTHCKFHLRQVLCIKLPLELSTLELFGWSDLVSFRGQSNNEKPLPLLADDALAEPAEPAEPAEAAAPAAPAAPMVGPSMLYSFTCKDPRTVRLGRWSFGC